MVKTQLLTTKQQLTDTHTTAQRSQKFKKGSTYACAKNTITKTYEMSVGYDSINAEFFGSNRQFD